MNKKTRGMLLAVFMSVAMAFTFMPAVPQLGIGTEDIFAAAKPAKVKGLKVTGSTVNSITLKWSKTKRAQKYEVYRAQKNKKGGFSKYKNIKKTKKLTF